MALRKTALARQLRRTLTPPEQLLWQRLRRSADGQAFRRQHPLGPYILDFYCPAAKLAVEVDGTLHNEEAQHAHDLRRDVWLRAQKIEVYRIPAAEVYRDADGVADGIKLMANARVAARKKAAPPPPA